MKLGKILRTLGMGTFILAASQHTHASTNNNNLTQDVNVQSSTLDRKDDLSNKAAEQIQNEKLKSLATLPKDKEGEIARGLFELSAFYETLEYENENVEGGPYATPETAAKRHNLLNSGKEYFQTIFEKCINNLMDGNIQRQATGLANLNALNKVIPKEWKTSTSIDRYVSIDDCLGLLTKKTLNGNTKDEKELEFSLKVGFLLLDITQSGKFAEVFCKYVDFQTENVVKENNTNPRDQKKKYILLEEAIRKRLAEYCYRFSYGSSPGPRLILGLLGNYSRIIQENNSDPAFLFGGIQGIKLFKTPTRWLTTDPISQEKYYKELTSLIEIVFQGVNLQKEKKDALIKESLTILQDYKYDPQNRQDEMVTLASKYFFQKWDIEGLFNFIDAALDINNDGDVRTERISRYMFSRIINQNPEYFISCVNFLILDYNETKNPGHEADLNGKLGTLFILSTMFSDSLPYIYPSREMTPSEKEFHKKTATWVNDNIEKPLLEALLDKIENYSFNARKEGGELYVGNNNWNSIFRLVRFISGKRGAFKSDAIKVLTNRLKKEQNPYARSACYVALEHDLRREEANHYNNLLNGLLNEDSPQAVKGIGSVCAYTQNEKLLEMIFKDAVKVGDFIHILENINKSPDPLKALCELDTKGLSSEEKLIITALRIVSGDTEFSKSLLGIENIPPPEINTVKGKTEITYSRKNKEYSEALKKLHHNAFIFLTATCSRFKAVESFPRHREAKKEQYLDLVTRYKKFVTDFLEKNFEFNILGIDRLSPENWGEKVAALFEVYNSNEQTSLEQGATVKEHGKLLDDFFFGRNNSIFNLWGQTLIRQALRENGKSDFELSSGLDFRITDGITDFEVRYPDYKQENRSARRELDKQRLRMAEGIIRSAEHGGLTRLTNFVLEDMPQGHFTKLELDDPYKYLRAVYD